MSEIIEIMQKQLDIEIKSAKQKLTASNLDSIYKLTTVIRNMSNMETRTEEKPKYSDGVFEKNIDALYEKYMTAKKSYRQTENKPELIESVNRLMAEVYDMVSAMLKDCECEEEKRVIQVNVRKLSEI